jgi:hypothetical protein
MAQSFDFRKLLWVTPAGEAAAAPQMRGAAQRVQERLVAPRSQGEAAQLKSLLAKRVSALAVPGNARAPHQPLSHLPPLSSP